MDAVVQRYALLLPADDVAVMHATPRVVVVHRTPDVVGGLPVYEDPDGAVRAVIEHLGVARLLDTDSVPTEQPVTSVIVP
ncbi:DUF6296 family protein [Kitasatospora sp. NPDC056138]|uniref:DUF6296 family protein n=1 Tax=Kitasatospora sp. NPDC056138 TaxID=3345724 RepID=UPI0035D83F3A